MFVCLKSDPWKWSRFRILFSAQDPCFHTVVAPSQYMYMYSFQLSGCVHGLGMGVRCGCYDLLCERHC